uniref:Uncharacterized protein n=1 Tax=Marmota marmota marmota TaxID=9994 RepID=A0A8C6AC38_MARMA
MSVYLCVFNHVAQTSLELLGSNCSLTSTSPAAGVLGMSHLPSYPLLIFKYTLGYCLLYSY